MATKATIQWLTASLYYGEPWEYFLVKAIKPYADVVLQTGVAECFFFERNWQPAPHIRLFFKGNADVLQHILQPNLQEHFQQYFEARPSSAPAGRDAAALLPGNAVQVDIFDPDQWRAGGGSALALCEKQYQASSLIVLGKLRDKINHWSYNELVSTAIKLHLGFAYAVGMGIEEAARFFQFLELDWMTHHMGLPDLSQEEGTLSYFRRIFESQQGDIVSYHAALWELFKNYRKTEDELFVEWFHTNANVALELSFALESGKLPITSGLFPEEQFDHADQARLWNFFAEFVQATNNRLGIRGRDEGYLYFAMSKSLRAVIATFYPKKKMASR